MKKNIQFQDIFSFITKLIDRLDGGKSDSLEKALDLVKKGKADQATEILVTQVPEIELCLGCTIPVEKKNPETDKLELVHVPDRDYMPDFIIEAIEAGFGKKSKKAAEKVVEAKKGKKSKKADVGEGEPAGGEP